MIDIFGKDALCSSYFMHVYFIIYLIMQGWVPECYSNVIITKTSWNMDIDIARGGKV